MSLTLLLIGAGVFYVMSRPSTVAANTGAKPRTNAFTSGKAYAQSLYNVNLSNGYVPSKAIGWVASPKYYVNDRIGLKHTIHVVNGSTPHCDCRKDGPAH